MFYFRACTKCSGDMYRGEDVYGSYIACIQCGTYLTAAQEGVLLGHNQQSHNGSSNNGHGIEQIVLKHCGLLLFLMQQDSPLSMDNISEKLGEPLKLIKGLLGNMMGDGYNSGYVTRTMYNGQMRSGIGPDAPDVVKAFKEDVSESPTGDYVLRRNIMINFIGHVDRKQRSSRSGGRRNKKK